MAPSLQSKGDGEYAYSAPFAGLNVSVPSILLPPNCVEAQCSPSFSIVRGSISAPWPYAQTLFGQTLITLGDSSYFLFVTPSGYVVTAAAIYQIQPQNNVQPWKIVKVASFPAGSFPVFGAESNVPVPWVESNGCLYISSLLGIFQYSPANGLIVWSVAFSANYMTISNQRMVAIGLSQVSENVTPGTPSGSQATGGSLPDGTYYFVVTAVFGSGTEGPPSAEGSFTISGGGGAGVLDLTWAAVTGAVSYNIYVGTASGEENAVYTSSTNSIGITTYTAGTASPPVMPPLGVWTIAWSAVSDFSDTSFGDFNANPNTSSGVIGGFDVLTNYTQGIPVGIINLGHSFYVQMTQGVVEVDPAQNEDSAFTLYNYWQEGIQVGAIAGTVAQYGPIGCFVTPDNVDIWIPGQQTQIGSPIMPLLRKIFLNGTLQPIPNAVWPLIQNPPVNASFVTIFNELHYILAFNFTGIPPQQFAPPYPNQENGGQFYGLILDYNFASQSWSQQVTPPLLTPIFQLNGPPLTVNTALQAIPQQTILIAGTPSGGWIIFCADVANPLGFVQTQGVESSPQPCQVGFPQTPITAGHRPTFRRVRIECSWDEMTIATGAAPVSLTISIQGTITQNTAAPNSSSAVFTSTVYSETVTIQVEPPGAIGVASGDPVVPFLTINAYADFTQSFENAQISLNWTDPSAHQRLMIHRVTPVVNDTKGTMQ